MKNKQKSLKKQIFEFLEEQGGWFNYNDASDELVEEFGIDKELAESYVWDFASGLYKLK